MKHSTKWAVLFAIVLVMGLFSFGGSQQTVMTATPYQCGGGSPYNPEETCYTYTNSQPNGWKRDRDSSSWCLRPGVRSSRTERGRGSVPSRLLFNRRRGLFDAANPRYRSTAVELAQSRSPNPALGVNNQLSEVTMAGSEHGQLSPEFCAKCTHHESAHRDTVGTRRCDYRYGETDRYCSCINFVPGEGPKTAPGSRHDCFDCGSKCSACWRFDRSARRWIHQRDPWVCKCVGCPVVQAPD